MLMLLTDIISSLLVVSQGRMSDDLCRCDDVGHGNYACPSQVPTDLGFT